MNQFLRGLPLAIVLLLPVAGWAGDGDKTPPPTPVMRTVDPYMAKSGDVVTVTGVNLSAKTVAEVYLLVGTKQVKLVVTDQTEESLKFTVPQKVEPGRYPLMVLTKVEPMLIEQPVKINVNNE